ncbi:electron transport complex, RnfABCDGE type, C subunit [[Clostridium] nexile DSM 1787]|jgi:RnfABCDGE-type electron transport complex C subunit|nr:electron transport complex, RnfABCDGE type, C subunit [[Clostridium] nexile DSM 1787]
MKGRNVRMGLLTFKGGIHPNDGKSLAKDKAIVTVMPKGDLIYPLSQHIGAPASPIVSVGDHVLKGQKIAEAGGFVSAPIHASVSGTVKAIEPHFNPTGSKVNCIVVENDGEYQEVEYTPSKPLDELTKEEILNLIGEAGIVGMGGAGFPTKVKLSPKEPEKIEYVIANCAECEPYITADYRRMLENPEELVSGMKVVLKLFDNAKGIFGVEDNKPDCIAKLKELTKDEPRMEVLALKTKYPQGAERQLIFATTGRAINSSMLPADAGCVVDNVETLIGIHYAVIDERPVMERIVTVSGDGVKAPGNFKVLFGTNQRELVEAAGGFLGEPEKVISGGPMMGFAMFTLDTPITKTSSSILCLTKDEVAANEPSACINCGRCVEVCPSRIIPSRLADFAEHHNEEAFTKWEGLECVECGSCSYVCPAKRQLKQAIGSMRKIALANRRKK